MGRRVAAKTRGAVSAGTRKIDCRMAGMRSTSRRCSISLRRSASKYPLQPSSESGAAGGRCKERPCQDVALQACGYEGLEATRHHQRAPARSRSLLKEWPDDLSRASFYPLTAPRIGSKCSDRCNGRGLYASPPGALPHQASLSRTDHVFSVGEREQSPAFALEEGASRAPDGLGTAEHHFFAALHANKDYAPRRTDHACPPSVQSPFAGSTLAHPRGRHKVNLPRLRATSASPTTT
jgi:hypothetical protein